MTDTTEFQYPEGFWPNSDYFPSSGKSWRQKTTSFSTPKGFGPIVTWWNDMPREWLSVFQYPEGFWPDSDCKSCPGVTHPLHRFSTPKGFGPIVTPCGANMASSPQHQECFSTPKGFCPIVTGLVNVSFAYYDENGQGFSTPKGFCPIVTPIRHTSYSQLPPGKVSVPRRVFAR